MSETGWHLKREVTVGTIVSIVIVGIGLIGGWTALDRRVTRTEVMLENSNSLLQEIREDIRGLREELTRSLRERRQ